MIQRITTKPRTITTLTVLGSALAIVLAACAGPATPPTPVAGPTTNPTPGVLPGVATPAPTVSLPPGSVGPTIEREIEPFDATNFSDPTTISNEWFSLVPGTQWTYDGHATIDGVLQTRHVILTIIDLTKTIGGIRSVVGYETDFTNGVLTEAELAFWAQDDDGTVWRMGEYPEVYEDGEIVETPAWFHGLDEAAAGVSMWPVPKPFTVSYAQGWGPNVGWNDRGRVFDVGSETCTPVSCYSDVLIIAEFSVDEPDVYQLKYYARGTGLVRVGWAGAREEEREELELATMTVLSPAELDAIRAAALAQEARGYELNDVYAETPPLEP